MLKAKVLVPLLAVVLVLVYVPGAGVTVPRGVHEVGAFLTGLGRQVGHVLDSVTS
jgi:hypothetical protein